MIDASRRGAALTRALWARADRLLHEIAKFGVVGIGAFVIDIGSYTGSYRRRYDVPYYPAAEPI